MAACHERRILEQVSAMSPMSPSWRRFFLQGGCLAHCPKAMTAVPTETVREMRSLHAHYLVLAPFPQEMMQLKVLH